LLVLVGTDLAYHLLAYATIVPTQQLATIVPMLC